MKVHRDMRALLSETTPVVPGRTSAEETARVALPGDPVEAIENPYMGRNPQGLLRLLRAGSLSSDEEGQVREAIRVFEGFSGDRLTGGMARTKAEAPAAPEDALPDVSDNPDRVLELEDVFRSMGRSD